MDLSRFKNYGLWVSLLALMPFVLEVFGVKVVPEQYDMISKLILGVLVGAGVISNPTSGAGYRDAKPVEQVEPIVEENKEI